MTKWMMLLGTGIIGFTASAQAVCTVYIEPYKPTLQSAQDNADDKAAYDTLVKIVKEKGWTLSRYENTADLTAYASCLRDRGDMMATIFASANKTNERADFTGEDYGFFVYGECAPAVRDAGKKFPYCE